MGADFAVSLLEGINSSEHVSWWLSFIEGRHHPARGSQPLFRRGTASCSHPGTVAFSVP